MARIAIGGWQHETNTFAPIKADFPSFEEANDWPGLCRGQALFTETDGVHLPITGALHALRAAGHELAPLLWCSATPCAHVTERAYEMIADMILEDLRAAGPLDGIYLDLHGAMVAEHLEDGEGEILRRIRAELGPELPIAISLDLHANLTMDMVEQASVIDIFRTYPHIDMGETGARTARHLMSLIDSGEAWAKAYRQIDFLIPINWGCTLIEPAKGIYAALPEANSDEVPALAFACGFPLSDIADAGPALVSYGRNQRVADDAADRLLALVESREGDFHGKIYDAQEAVEEALSLLHRHPSGPVVIADTQDNPGGGGPGDTTGMLKALLAADAKESVLGLLCDPVAAAMAHNAGGGTTLPLALGEHSGMPGHSPLEGDFKVLRLSDGRFTATGPMYAGAHMDLGPCALLEISGIRILVSSKASQAADQSMFRQLGVEPTEERLMVLKSSVHFRNDFQDIASAILIAAAPGPVYGNPADLNFENLRPGVRLSPQTES